MIHEASDVSSMWSREQSSEEMTIRLRFRMVPDIKANAALEAAFASAEQLTRRSQEKYAAPAAVRLRASP
jgi:hypothetical protein